MAESFNPYYKWLGISPQEQPANHYRLLGLRLFEDDPEVIESAADRQMAHVQTHKTGPHSSLSQKLLNELATVRLCLLDPAKKADYDQSLRTSLLADTPAPAMPVGVPSAVPAISIVTAAPLTPSIALESSPRHSELAARGRRSKRSLIPALSIALTLLALGAALFFNAQRPATPPVPPSQATAVGNATDDIPMVGTQSKSAEPVPITNQATANQPLMRDAAVASVTQARVATNPSPPPAPMPESPPSPESNGRPERLAAPQNEDLATAEAAVDTMFQAEISAAKTPIEQHAVARRLLDRSFAPDLTPAVSYVLLERCSRIAADSGRYDVACEAIDTLAARFETNVVERKMAALETSDRFAKATAELRKLTESWMDQADEATDADQYPAAKQCLARAAAAARKTGDRTLIARAVESGKEAAARLAAHEAVTTAREQWRTNPDDATAAAAWGRFLCVYKGDWDAGLSLWAKGDHSLAEAAQSDLARPPFATDQIALADRWWDAAENEQEPLPQKVLRLRAAHWYRQARIGASRSELVRIEQRIDQAEQIASAFPVGEWIDLLKSVDLSRHLVRGNWTTNGNVLATPGGRGDHRLQLPVTASDSYEFEVSLTIAPKGGPEVNFLFPVGSQNCSLILFGWGGKTSGLHRVDGKLADNNETTRRLAAPRGQRFKVLIQVESTGDQASVTVELNSRDFIRWQGASSRLSVGPHMTLPNPTAFGLRSLNSSILVHSVRLRILSGTAKRLE